MKSSNYPTKTIVLRSQLPLQKAKEMVNRKKVSLFRHFLIKPDKSQIQVNSLTLSYEPDVIASGKYTADYLRKAIQPIRVDENVKEVLIGEGIFPVTQKSSIVRKIEGKLAKNKVNIETEEHVFFENKKDVILDRHGIRALFSYNLENDMIENYPKKILEQNKVKELKITDEMILKKLFVKLKEKISDKDIRNLNEDRTVLGIQKIFVPIYEARLVGPKKKVKILRIDAVKKKVI